MNSNRSVNTPRHARIYLEQGMYEGMSIDKVPNGRGSLVYKRGSLASWKFKGDFLNGQIHGQGTLYDENNTPRYTGDWQDGRKSGHGKEFSKGGKIKYDGYWDNGKQDGYGTKYRDNGVDKIYQGEIFMDKRNGEGTEYSNLGLPIYSGYWENDRKSKIQN